MTGGTVSAIHADAGRHSSRAPDSPEARRRLTVHVPVSAAWCRIRRPSGADQRAPPLGAGIPRRVHSWAIRRGDPPVWACPATIGRPIAAGGSWIAKGAGVVGVRGTRR